MSHGIQNKCMKVPVVEEENSDDDDEDESGELAGVLSLFSCSLFKQYHLKSSVNAMTRQRAHSMTLIHHLQHPGPKFCTGLHRNSMYMICHSNCKYIFSNEKPTALPFEHNMEEAYKDMCAKYKWLMTLALLALESHKKCGR